MAKQNPGKRQQKNIVKRTILPKRANDSYQSLREDKYLVRAKKIFPMEPGFALLLLWCKLEILLKLNRYNTHIKEPWPDKLYFIRANWGPLAHIKSLDKEAYNLILGTNSTSLWKLRNEIAHSGKKIDKDVANQYWKSVTWVSDRLKDSLPSRDDMLAKKRRSNAQIKK